MDFLEYLLHRLPAYVFFTEIFMFAILDKHLWRTVVTPFNCLALPYALVVFICIYASGNGEVYLPFNFPCLWVFSIGLLLFYIPSFFLGAAYNSLSVQGRLPLKTTITLGKEGLLFLERLTRFLLALFLVWFGYLVRIMSFSSVGSDEFAERFAANGVFGHLFIVLMILFIVWTYLFDWKENKRYGIYILGIAAVILIYEVKGWLLIPLIGALFLRMETGKMKVSLKSLLLILFLGFSVFFLIYWLNLYVAKGQEGKEVFSFIPRHFNSYAIAGVFSFSEDMSCGIVEQPDPEKIFTPFINIYRFFKGEPYASPINDVFIRTSTYSDSNVRSFIGSLYIHLGAWGGAIFMLVYSVIVYVLYFLTKQKNSFFLWIFMGWIMGRLAMGWFEIYVQHLSVISVPLFILCMAAYTQYKELHE